MPSSHKSAVARPLQLDDLRAAPAASAPVAPVSFSAADAATARAVPHVFEVSSSAGIPDAVLAEARTAAQAAGYAAGWASGIRAARVVADAEAHANRLANEQAESERKARLQQAFTSVDRAAAALEARAVPSAEQIETLIVSSALAIAEELVGHSLRNDPERSEAALRRALSLTPADEPVTVRVSPADYAALKANESPAPQGLSRQVTLVEDAALAPGDAVARSGATEIDARIAAGLARIREVLSR